MAAADRSGLLTQNTQGAQTAGGRRRCSARARACPAACAPGWATRAGATSAPAAQPSWPSSASANAAFASELVQYTACYQLTAADACSATLGMCSWVASTGGAHLVIAVPAAFASITVLQHSPVLHFVLADWCAQY